MKRSVLTHRRLINIKRDQSKGYYDFDNQEIIEIKKSMVEKLKIQKKRELEGTPLTYELVDTSLTGL